MKKIRILETIPLYSDTNLESKTSQLINNTNIVDFNREKRRNGINWMEIFVNGKKLYVKKENDKMNIVKRAKLIDNSCTVIFYKAKDGGYHEFNEVFTPFHLENINQETITMMRIYDESQKKELVDLYYNVNNFEVSKSVFAKDEDILITNERKDFIEVLYGKKIGYVMGSVSYYEAKNWWYFIVLGFVLVLTIVGSVYIFNDGGWVVRGGIVLIPMVIASIVIIVFIKSFLFVINSIFAEIRKRF